MNIGKFIKVSIFHNSIDMKLGNFIFILRVNDIYKTMFMYKYEYMYTPTILIYITKFQQPKFCQQ